MGEPTMTTGARRRVGRLLRALRDRPTTPANEVHRAVRVLRALVAVLVVALALVIWRQVGEQARTARVVAANSAGLQAVIARLERETRADCAFKRDVAMLPAQSPKPSPVLVTLARDAREAYLGKGCPTAIDPRTGKPFGPPPAVPDR